MRESSNSTVFEPVAAPSTYAQTVLRLGTAIRIGILKPGTRLPPERDLAEQLGISRSTLRQALSTLTATGHLNAVRGRTGGTFVSAFPPITSGAPVDPERSRALLDWRMALEIGTVQLAAERATEAERAALELQAGACADPGDWPAFRRHDARFHLHLAEAAHSDLVVKAMTNIQGELSDIFSPLQQPDFSWAEMAQQHLRVAAAVARGDTVAAREEMSAHLAATKHRYDALINVNGHALISG